MDNVEQVGGLAALLRAVARRKTRLRRQMKALLGICIRNSGVENTLFAVALDMSTPWTALESLNRWVAAIKASVEVTAAGGTAR